MSKVKLTIDDVIAHCDRKVDSYKSTNIEEIIEEYGLEKNFIKEYLEHKQVAEWLRELKQLRGTLKRIVKGVKDAKDLVPVNRLLDDIINDKPKELGQLMAYDKVLKIFEEEGIIE